MTTQDDLLLFAPSASADLGGRVAQVLGTALAPCEEREFEDGEHKARPLTSVRGRDVYILQPLFGDERQSVNDKLCRLLFLIATLKDASAARVTAVVPYATIPFDVWAHRTGRLEGGWRREETDDPRDAVWVDRLVRWMLRHPILLAAALLLAVVALFTVLLIVGPPVPKA